MNNVNDGGDLGRGRETGVSRMGEQDARRPLRTVGSQGGAEATTSHPLRMQVYTGVVQKGSQRATSLGYPTINIPLEEEGVSGIYAARVVLKDEAPYMAAAFADSAKSVLEAYILDFNDDLYGIPVTIELHKKLRDSLVYEDDAALKNAIAQDILQVRKYFKK